MSASAVGGLAAPVGVPSSGAALDRVFRHLLRGTGRGLVRRFDVPGSLGRIDVRA